MLTANNEYINFKINNYEDFKKLFVFNDSKINTEKCKTNNDNDKLFQLFNEKKDNSIPEINFFNKLSFGDKILLLKKMKSAYWNKLFYDLIPKEEKDDFSMNTWNKFFDEIRHMRNTSSHTCANFKNKKTFNSIKIQRANKKI